MSGLGELREELWKTAAESDRARRLSDRGMSRLTGADLTGLMTPAADAHIRDTWHFTGMRGTGSNMVVAGGVFVPEHRLLPHQPLTDGETDGLVLADRPYRDSLTGAFVAGLTGSLVGGADTALRYALEHAPTRRVAGSAYAGPADSPTARPGTAAAATRVDTTLPHARRPAGSVDEHARADENPAPLTRARAHTDSTHVTHQCRAAVDEIVTLSCSCSCSCSSAFGVGSRYAGFGMGMPEQVHGTALVGEEPRTISTLV